MTEGLLDTSVVVDLPPLVANPDALPERALISAVPMAELLQGPLFARSEDVRRARSRLVLEVQRAFPSRWRSTPAAQPPTSPLPLSPLRRSDILAVARSTCSSPQRRTRMACRCGRGIRAMSTT